MISSLRIENFALIDEVHIQFTKGFTVITGETGSGSRFYSMHSTLFWVNEQISPS